jgi:lysophospholipase L1-like esterase
MPAPTPAELEAKLIKLETNMDRLDSIVNGDEDSTTTVDNALVVPSLANTMARVKGILKATWAAPTGLAAVVGQYDGQRATVDRSDVGTHTDPVVGGTVNNAGNYTWDVSGAGSNKWRWVSAGDFADEAATIAGTDDTLPTNPKGVKAALDDRIEKFDVDDDLYVNGHKIISGFMDKDRRVGLASGERGDVIVNGESVLEVTNEYEFWSFVALDKDERLGFGIDENGEAYYQGKNIHNILTSTEPEVALPALTAWGDSLTQGSGSTDGLTFPNQLATMLGRTVHNKGRGGQNTAQIAARMGSEAALVTVSGDEIPASGPVSVTAVSVQLMSYAGGAWDLDGWLAGVYGTLHEDGTAIDDFTRLVDGSVVPCPPNTPFIPDNTLYAGTVPILWPGRNDYSGLTDSTALALVNTSIFSRVEVMVSVHSILDERCLILGVTGRGDASGYGTIEYEGTNNYNAKRDLAAMYAKRFPRQFIDIDMILRANGNGGTDDNTDIANGIPPRSLMAADLVHFNNDGYAVIAAACRDRLNLWSW